MNIPVAQTFLGLIKIMSWCIYVMLAVVVFIVAASVVIRKLLVRVGPMWPFDDPAELVVRGWSEILSIATAAFGATWFLGRYLSHSSDGSIRVVGGILIALIFGLVLFSLKVRTPLIYGGLELCFAIGSSRYSLSKIDADFTSGATVVFLTSIYLMVRAFDNIKKGLDERKNMRKEKSKKATATTETPNPA
jgi:hypothetical protein